MLKVLRSLNNIGNLLFVLASIGAVLALSGLLNLFLLIAPPVVFLAFGSIILTPIAIPYGLIRSTIELKRVNFLKGAIYLVLTLANTLFILGAAGIIPVSIKGLTN